MRYKAITVSFFLLFIIIKAGIDDRVEAQDKLKLESWKVYSPQNGGFKVLFPEKPSAVVNYDNPTTGTLEENILTLKFSIYEFSVAAFEYLRSEDDPGAIGRILDNAFRQIIKQEGGNLVRTKNVYLKEKYQGREFIVNSAKGIVVRRIYWVYDTLYQLVYVQNGASLDESIANKFLNSLVLTSLTKLGDAQVLSLPDNGGCDGSSGATSPILVGNAFMKIGLRAPKGRIPYPQEALAKRVQGVVRVEFAIDEQGKPVSVEIKSGPQELRSAVLEAARKSTFLPMMFCGKAVKVKGELAYKFTLR